MYKTVKTQTNLPLKICHLKVALRPGRLKYGLISIAWVIVHMRDLSHPESG